MMMMMLLWFMSLFQNEACATHFNRLFLDKTKQPVFYVNASPKPPKMFKDVVVDKNGGDDDDNWTNATTIQWLSDTNTMSAMRKDERIVSCAGWRLEEPQYVSILQITSSELLIVGGNEERMT
jgi:hypothetical protein